MIVYNLLRIIICIPDSLFGVSVTSLCVLLLIFLFLPHLPQFFINLPAGEPWGILLEYISISNISISNI